MSYSTTATTSKQAATAQKAHALPAERPPRTPDAGDGQRLGSLPEVAGAVERALRDQPITDIHTHLYPAAFGTPSPRRQRTPRRAGTHALGRG